MANESIVTGQITITVNPKLNQHELTWISSQLSKFNVNDNYGINSLNLNPQSSNTNLKIDFTATGRNELSKNAIQNALIKTTVFKIAVRHDLTINYQYHEYEPNNEIYQSITGIISILNSKKIITTVRNIKNLAYTDKNLIADQFEEGFIPQNLNKTDHLIEILPTTWTIQMIQDLITALKNNKERGGGILTWRLSEALDYIKSTDPDEKVPNRQIEIITEQDF